MRTLLRSAILFAVLCVPACSKPAELTLGTGTTTMTYGTTTLTVRSGQTVHLTLQNHATDPTMSHNWVVVNPGSEASVAAEAQKAGAASGFIPMVADVIAHTPQVAPGKSGDVTFTAPAAGSYPYLCTNPGHAQTMHGTLQVTP